MESFLPTIILRHKKENLKKCSLRGLEARSDMLFFSYPKATLPKLDGYVHLSLTAPPLTLKDKKSGLFLLDSTWKYEKDMRRCVPENVIARSIPDIFVTAYPRKQTDCDLPDKGLASIEALFLAYLLMGKETEGLLNNYYWKDLFLEKNRDAFLAYFGEDLYSQLKNNKSS